MSAPLGELNLEPDPPEARLATSASTGRDRIAICMATHEPPPDLFRRQIASIREQTHTDWSCVISDDASSPAALATIRETLADDPRFQLAPNERRLGFFGNFERALRLAPADAAYVALADQDDRWHPEKLAALVEAIGDANVAYSDARVVRADGGLQSSTYWSERPNQWTDLTSLVLANTVTGAAALYRRSVVEAALPFPTEFGRPFHDHWLALVGLATGEIRYVERPLYDYVQHEAAALGHERASAWASGRPSLRRRARTALLDPQYLWGHWRTTYFTERCRGALFARVLLLRFAAGLDPGDAASLRLLAGPDSLRLARWLAGRRFGGDGATLGAEGRLLRALAWRFAAAGRRRSGPLGRWRPAPGSASPPDSCHDRRAA